MGNDGDLVMEEEEVFALCAVQGDAEDAGGVFLLDFTVWRDYRDGEGKG